MAKKLKNEEIIENEEIIASEETIECMETKEKACCRISKFIEMLKKPFVKYDFDIVRSVHADEDSEPIAQDGAHGSFKIRLLDVVLALTFIVAIISIFSKNDD